MPAESLQTNDEYTLNSLKIINYKGEEFDIIDPMIYFVIEESLFDSFVVGEIMIEDSIGFQSSLPLIGNEKLVINYTLDPLSDESIIREFSTYAVPTVTTMENKRTLIVNFCSTEMLNAMNRRVSKGYTAKTAADIITDMYNEFIAERLDSKKKDIFIDDMIGIFDHVFPRLTPIEIVQTVCGMSTHGTQKRSAFLFYENFDGFHVNNLETIFNSDSDVTFDTTIDVNPEQKNGLPSLHIIKNWQVIRSPDMIDLLHEGAWGTRMISYDPLAKEIDFTNYNHLDSFDGQSHIGSAPIVNRDYENINPSQDIKFFPTKTYRREIPYYKSNSPTENSTRPEVIYPTKRSLLAQFDALALELDVSGGTFVKAGDKITLNIPENSMYTEAELDNFYSGDYIVTKVKHSFSVKTIETRIICQRDSFNGEFT